MKTLSIKRSRSGFTLIELLVVITIIAILASAGFVVGGSMLNKARKLSAQAAATSIEQAVNAFHSEYGYFPVEGGVNRVDTSSDTGFLRTLVGDNLDLNPRKMRFLTAKEGKRRANGGVDGLVFTDAGAVRGMYDPWGNGFTVVMDTEGEDRITFQTPDNKSVTLNGRKAAVFSPGVPDGETVTTDTLVKSW